MENFRRKDRFYTIAFALVDAFASLEVGAVIVINARIAESLGLAEELSGYVITAYLYPLFGVLLLALVFDRRIRNAASPRDLFLAGLALFAAGNGVCALAPGAPSFFAGRFVMSAGAALAFVGQLWTASSFFSARLMAILVWGEVGAAVGDIAGPVIGGFFAGVAPGGWRAGAGRSPTPLPAGSRSPPAPGARWRTAPGPGWPAAPAPPGPRAGPGCPGGG